MAKTTNAVWKSPELAATFLEGVRGAIPFAQAQIDIMLRLIAACERPVERILDLGCGDGVLAAAVLDRYPQVRAVLLDFSEPMVEAARKRFAGRAGSVDILTLDYGQSAWTSAAAPFGPFDAVVSGFSIHHQPDSRKREIYSEIHELLAPGGIFINVEHVAPGFPVARPHERRGVPGRSASAGSRQFRARKSRRPITAAPTRTPTSWRRSRPSANGCAR